jgi:hypothetical protein
MTRPAACLAFCLLVTPALADDPKPATRLPRENMLVYHDDAGAVQPVRNVDDWQKRRQEILRGMQAVMGKLPGAEKRCPLDVKVESEVDCGKYVRRLISYASQPGGRVPAYLCVPKALLQGDGKKAPAVLCPHPTNQAIGHGTVVGLGGQPNRAYASELAERGFVTLAPSYPLLANYQPDLRALGWESGTLKAVWDNMRGLDLLETLPYVQPVGFGAVGHSLGGHNSVYTAVFDDRIKAVVSCCGLDQYVDYMKGNPAVWELEKGWCQTRYMPKLANYRGRLEAIPVDFSEMVAALAPRNVLIVAPLRDANFQSESVDRIAAAARPVFTLYAHPERFRILHPDCEHDFPDAMRQTAYELFESVLR